MANARTVSITAILVVAVLAAIAGSGWYIYEQQNYVSTDNAAIQSTLIPITATGDGTLANWLAPTGSTVQKGRSLGEVNGILNNNAIPAPATGTIVQNNAVDNETVVPGEPLGYIVNLNNLQVVANVDEGEIGNVTVGKTVDITVDAYPGTPFTGLSPKLGVPRP